MADALRVCLFNRDPSKNEVFGTVLGQLRNAEVVAQTDVPEDLKEWVRHGEVDLVIVNLDDADDKALPLVQDLLDVRPGIGVLGVSQKTDPNTIISAMRAGCSQFVPWPVDLEDLRAAVGRIRSTRVTAVQASKRFCVIGSSGGAGATTVACNLAMELGHLSDRRCALIDLNLEFGDICCAFDCTPKYTVSDICRDDVEIDRVLLEKAMHDLPCNVAVLGRPNKLEEAREVTPDGIVNTLQILAGTYPFVVVDLPRYYSFLSAAALEEADRVLIVTQLGVSYIRNATRIFQSLRQMGADERRVEIVLNRCKANFERITPDEVEEHFGRPIFAMIPNDYRRVQSALDLGQPIGTDAPQSPARIAIQEMARKLVSEDPTGEPARPAPTAGFLSKFWRRSGKVHAD